MSWPFDCSVTNTSQTKNVPSSVPAHFPIALIRALRRDTLRLALPFTIMPFCAARASTGCAFLSAAAAADWSPEAMASSTRRTSVRIPVRRVLLISVRRIICRAAFFAEDVLAICSTLLELEMSRRRRRGAGSVDWLRSRNRPRTSVPGGKIRRTYTHATRNGQQRLVLTLPAGVAGRLVAQSSTGGIGACNWPLGAALRAG